MDWKLEFIVIPVSNLELAKEFYLKSLGFEVLKDVQLNPDRRVIRLVPPGSNCAIVIGDGLSDLAPGSAKGMYLMVTDIVSAAEQLRSHGVTVNGPYHFVDGIPAPGAHPTRDPFNSFLDFADPDGNVWVVQEVPAS